MFSFSRTSVYGLLSKLVAVSQLMATACLFSPAARLYGKTMAIMWSL